MTPRPLAAGDVVQISPESPSAFAGCFMLVTDPKSWGAQGFIAMPERRGELPSRAFYRAKYDEMEMVGRATWISSDCAEDGDE